MIMNSSNSICLGPATTWLDRKATGKKTYENYMDGQILNENISFHDIREKIVLEIWSRNKVVHFLR